MIPSSSRLHFENDMNMPRFTWRNDLWVPVCFDRRKPAPSSRTAKERVIPDNSLWNEHNRLGDFAPGQIRNDSYLNDLTCFPSFIEARQADVETRYPPCLFFSHFCSWIGDFVQTKCWRAMSDFQFEWREIGFPKGHHRNEKSDRTYCH